MAGGTGWTETGPGKGSLAPLLQELRTRSVGVLPQKRSTNHFLWPQFLFRIRLPEVGPLGKIEKTELRLTYLSFLIGQMEITIVPPRMGWIRHDLKKEKQMLLVLIEKQ